MPRPASLTGQSARTASGRRLQPTRRLWVGLALIALVVLASVLFFYRLESIPIESDNVSFYTGIAALGVLNRGVLPFYLPDLGSPLVANVYLRAATVAVLGPSVLALRLPAAGFGIATVLYTFLLARELLRRESPFARDTGALFAPISWVLSSLPIQLVRLGVGASLPAAFQVAFLFHFLRGWKARDVRHFIGSGALLGAAMYTYLSAPALVLLPLLMVAHQAMWDRGLLLRNRRGLLAFTVAFLITVAPLALFTLSYPEAALERVQDVQSATGQFLPEDVGGGA